MGRLINADALAKNMCDCACADCDNERNINTKCSEIRLTYLRILDEQPTIEERKTGKWGAQGECPFCGYLRQWKDDKFCGNCGAKMEG
jgi:hypothetical protein